MFEFPTLSNVDSTLSVSTLIRKTLHNVEQFRKYNHLQRIKNQTSTKLACRTQSLNYFFKIFLTLFPILRKLSSEYLPVYILAFFLLSIYWFPFCFSNDKLGWLLFFTLVFKVFDVTFLLVFLLF